MNDQLRRYLSEDWESTEEITVPAREYQPTKRAAVQTRKQQEKQRGRAIAKQLRAIKQQRKSGKP